jgi:hypothetical protein
MVNRMRIGQQFAAVCIAVAALFLPASLRASDVLPVHGHIYTGVVMTMVGGKVVFHEMK